MRVSECVWAVVPHDYLCVFHLFVSSRTVLREWLALCGFCFWCEIAHHHRAKLWSEVIGLRGLKCQDKSPRGLCVDTTRRRVCYPLTMCVRCVSSGCCGCWTNAICVFVQECIQPSIVIPGVLQAQVVEWSSSVRARLPPLFEVFDGESGLKRDQWVSWWFVFFVVCLWYLYMHWAILKFFYWPRSTSCVFERPHNTLSMC